MGRPRKTVKAAKQDPGRAYPPDPASLVCPFTGEHIRIVESHGSFMGVTRYYSTKLFTTKRMLEYFLLSREGQPPAFNAVEVESMSERDPPPGVSPFS